MKNLITNRDLYEELQVSKKDWLQHAWIQKNNPWISEEDRQYWRDKIDEITKKS